jgi:hypothetical protein
VFYKISTYVLAAVIIVGAVVWSTSHKNETKVTQGNASVSSSEQSSQQLKNLQDQLQKIQDENTGLRRNASDYLTAFDALIEKIKPALPAMNNPSEQALAYAKEYLQANKHNGKPILDADEVVVYLETNNTDTPSQIAVSVVTYKKQAKLSDQLPMPVSITLGGQKTMVLQKKSGSWEVVDIQSIY